MPQLILSPVNMQTQQIKFNLQTLIVDFVFTLYLNNIESGCGQSDWRTFY